MVILCQLLLLYVIVLFGRIILSWFPISPGSSMASIYSFLHLVTEPVLGPFRRVIPPISVGGAGFDLSPMIVLFGIQIIRGAICA